VTNPTASVARPRAHRAGRFLAAIAVAGGVLLATASTTSAAGAEVLASAQCDGNHDGVVDVTLVNNTQASADFNVGGQSYQVAAGGATALSYTGLADGMFNLSASANGVDQSVAMNIDCDAPQVAVLGTGGGALPATGAEVKIGLAIGVVLVVAGIAASLLARRRYSRS
jgi:LPXTG-motif cell wall-anchored protein